MSPVLYPVVGVGAIAALIAVCYVISVLWPVLIGLGLVGLVSAIGGGLATVAGEPPNWIVYLALGSCACVLVGMVGANWRGLIR